MMATRPVFDVRTVRTARLLVAVLLIGNGSVCGQSRAGDPVSGPDRAIYKPVAADSSPAYMNDPANGQKQTWSEYWGWVTSYYQGTLVSNGWIRETEISLARMKDPAQRAALLKEMNEAGRLVSREWAKDGSVRKINTSDLIAWGNRLGVIRRQDKGVDAELLTTARQIHEEAKRKVAGKPKSN